MRGITGVTIRVIGALNLRDKSPNPPSMQLDCEDEVLPARETGKKWILVTFTPKASRHHCHMSHSLSSLKGGYIRDYIGGYYRGY